MVIQPWFWHHWRKSNHVAYALSRNPDEVASVLVFQSAESLPSSLTPGHDIRKLQKFHPIPQGEKQACKLGLGNPRQSSLLPQPCYSRCVAHFHFSGPEANSEIMKEDLLDILQKGSWRKEHIRCWEQQLLQVHLAILSPNLARRKGNQISKTTWPVDCTEEEENTFLCFDGVSVPKSVALVFLATISVECP